MIPIEVRAHPHDIAYCQTHGLHGEREECFECGRDVEQMPMVWIGLMPWAFTLGFFVGALVTFAFVLAAIYSP